MENIDTITVKVDEILMWYDAPQIITLTDNKGDRWIGVAVLNVDCMSFPMFCVPVSETDLFDYFDNKVDLRTLFEKVQPEQGALFDYSHLAGNESREFYVLESEHVFSEYLPEPGFYARSHSEEASGRSAPSG